MYVDWILDCRRPKAESWMCRRCGISCPSPVTRVKGARNPCPEGTCLIKDKHCVQSMCVCSPFWSRDSVMSFCLSIQGPFPPSPIKVIEKIISEQLIQFSTFSFSPQKALCKMLTTIDSLGCFPNSGSFVVHTSTTPRIASRPLFWLLLFPPV